MNINNNTAGAVPTCDDAAFGPVIVGCRQDFDFTLAFQHYVFSVLPSVLLLLAAPVRILILRRHEAKVDVRGNVLKYAKLTIIAAFSALQLTLLILFATSPTTSRTSALTSSSLSLAASLALLPLSHMEHVRSLRPSLLLSGYLLLTLVLDSATLRTFWTTSSSSSSSTHPTTTPAAIRATFTACFTVKAVMLSLEGAQKRRFMRDAYRGRSPEEYAGLFGQGLMWWVGGMVRYGARYAIRPGGLYRLAGDMQAEGLGGRFERVWDGQQQQQQEVGGIGKGRRSLGWTLGRMLWVAAVVPVVPRVALLGFTMCQPLLIRRLLEFLAGEEKDGRVGYGLVGATGVVYVGMAVSGAVYWHRHYRFMAMVRGTLTTAVYKKALTMEVDVGMSAKTVTLMSADCERIVRGCMDLHEVWANVAQVGLATWLIQVQLGVACVAPVAVTLVTAGLTGYAAMYTPKFQMLWIEKLEKRISVTSSILGSMKSIKISSLTSNVLNLLNSLRQDELAAASKFRVLSIVTAIIGYVPQLASPVITFSIFIAIARSGTATLDPARMFTSISLLFLVSDPLFNLFAGLMDVMSAIGCLSRVDEFLQSPSRTDTRTTTNLVAPSPPCNDYEMEKSADSNTNEHNMAISVTNGTFGWKRDGTSNPVLSNINLAIPSGSIVFVKGPVGCGKSTLIKALLGETPFSSGSVMVSSPEIALCEQSPFIMNESIRSNITISSPASVFDPELYATVIDCCALGPDLACMEGHGDMTVVGSKGFSLSAGQRQRVALARAVYSRKSIALLDDVFSQLDADTSSVIARKLIGPNGLYRRWGTTVVLVTSSDRFLHYASKVIELSSAGEIVEGPNDDQTPAVAQASFDDDGIAVSSGQFATTTTPEKSTNDSEIPPATGPQTDPATADDDSETTNPEKRPETDRSVYKYYLQSVSWRRAVIFMVFQICLAFLSSFPVVWLKWWTDENPGLGDDRTSYYIGIYAALQGAALVASGLVTWWTLNILAVTIGLRLHEALSDTVMSSTLKLFSSNPSGSILNRFTQDIQLADIQLPLSLQVVVTNLLITIAQAGLITSASLYIALSYPILLLLFYAIPKYYVRTARQMRTLDLEEKAPLYAQFLETLEGLPTLRAFGGGVLRAATAHNYALVDRSQRPFYLMYVLQKWLGLVLDFAVAGLATLVVGVAVALRETVSAGFTGVSLTQVVSFTSYLKMMVLFWAQLQTAMAAVERIRGFGRDTEREDDGPSPGEVEEDVEVEPPAEWPTQGEIHITDLSARYYSADASTTTGPTLDSITLHLPPATHTAIVGRTGSGKSTLLLTVLRLLDPTAGSISIDNTPLHTVPRHVLRSRVVGVAEEPFIFPGRSVRYNLDPGGGADDERIVQTLAEVGLWRGVFDDGEGLDGMLEGERLSFGQRQLLGVARGLVRGGRVFLLDEVGSGLDAESERTINRVIETRLRGFTVVSVVHKMESALGFQNIVVMDKGRVVEVGEPKTLMARPGSRFRELVETSRSVAS